MNTAVLHQTLQTIYNAERCLWMTRSQRDAAAYNEAIAILKQAAKDVLGVRSTQ